MKKQKITTIEDRIFVAERQYDRMIENINNGIINKDEIIIAISGIQTAHYMALKQNKAHLIR